MVSCRKKKTFCDVLVFLYYYYHYYYVYGCNYYDLFGKLTTTKMIVYLIFMFIIDDDEPEF